MTQMYPLVEATLVAVLADRDALTARVQELEAALRVYLGALRSHAEHLPADDGDSFFDIDFNVMSSLGYLLCLDFGHGARDDDPVLYDALATLAALAPQATEETT